MKKTGIFRAASVLLIASVVFTLFPAFPITVHAETEGAYTYEINNGEATITGVDKNIAGDVVIPDTLGGYPVVGIGSGFEYMVGGISYYNQPFAGCTNSFNLTIPKSVRRIAEYALSGCNTLTSIHMAGVNSIGEYAFADCSNLTDVIIGDGLLNIDEMAFGNCISLKNLELPDSLTYIGMSAFSCCRNLNNLTIPKNVEQIDRSAFSSCDNLEFVYWNAQNTSSSVDSFSGTTIGTIIFGESAETIPSSFYGANINKAIIPENVKVIREKAFYGSNLKEIDLLGTPSIGNNAFEECQIHRVNIADFVYWCGGDFSIPTAPNANLYINNEPATKIIIPDSVTEIYPNKFSNFINIKEVIIPSHVTEIGAYAFDGCTGLTSIDISKSVTNINGYTFRNCSSLSSIILPEGMTNIGQYAFYGCGSLRSIYMPNSVTSIGRYAFFHCSSMTDIYYGGTEEDWNSIENNTEFSGTVYYNCPISALQGPIDNLTASLYLEKGEVQLFFYRPTGADEVILELSSDGETWEPAETQGVLDASTNMAIVSGLKWTHTYYFRLRVIGGTREGISNVAEITMGSYAPSTDFVFDNGVITDFVGSGSVVIIPPEINGQKVEKIGDRAFADHYDLTIIEIPDGVTSIGSSAFYNCINLSYINLPDSVVNIGGGAFNDCSSLTSINIPDGVTSINAFENCSSLTSISIPDSVTSIGTWSFSGCSSLTSINIPDSVTSIGYSAFEDCTGLTSMSIPDSVASIGEKAFKGCESLAGITIPNGIINIDDNVFEGCKYLTSIDIPNSVTSIDDDVFLDCENLTDIYYAGTQEQWEQIQKGETGLSENITIHYEVCSILNLRILSAGNNGTVSLLFSRPEGAETVVMEQSVNNGATWEPATTQELLTGDSVIANITGLEIGKTYYFRLNVAGGSRAGLSNTCKYTALQYTPESDFYFNNGTITRYIGDDTQVNIPSTIQNIPVRVIGRNAFSGRRSLTNINIPNSVRGIDSGAFEGCSSLTSISIPDSVTSIGGSAFKNCSNLTSISIPNSVTTIEGSAFEGCRSLTSINIPDSITSINNWVFHGCSSLTSISIPDSVTTIERSAFDACSSLTSISIPDGVTSIGDDAFSGCNSLASISIPDSVTTIGRSAFSGCSNLKSVYITDISAWCRINFQFGGNPFYYGTDLYLNDELVENLMIPDGVTSINNYAFEYCNSLASISIPDSVTTIGDSAFKNCSNLTSISIPDSVTTIGDSAFEGCSSLTSISIPDSVTTIGISAFEGCSSLTNISIPNSVASISYSAFSGCSSLISISIPNSVTSIGSYAFSGCSSLESVYITDIGAWCRMNFSIWASSPLCYGADLYLNNELVENLVIPDDVTSIGNRTFSGCRSLTSISIPDSVTSIGDSAFSGCGSLTGISIPDSVTNIESSAFTGCSSLTNVTIPDGVKEIRDNVFSHCDNLMSVDLPDSLTSVGKDIFYNCPKLTDIYYTGTEEQWKQLSMNSDLVSERVKVHYKEHPISNLRVLSTGEEMVTLLFSRPVKAENVVLEQSVDNGFTWTEAKTTEPLSSRCVTAVITGLEMGTTYSFRLNVTGGSYPGFSNICKYTAMQYTPESDFNFNNGEITRYIGDDAQVNIPPTIQNIPVSSIGDRTFSSCNSLTSINIPYGVTSIDGYAFEDCSSLTSISIPDSVTSIGDHAFSDCSSLTGISIPDSVTSIGDRAFSFCNSLTSINIPDGITSIGEGAFFYCSSLTSISIPDSVTSIGDMAFKGCDSLTGINISDSATSIGGGAFEDCSSLTGISIPDSVTNIGGSAFKGCVSLTSINIPNGVTSIVSYAFSGCSSLTDIQIPDSVTSIGYRAFSGCDSLTAIRIPESVVTIEDYAFVACDNLKDVYYEGSESTWKIIEKGNDIFPEGITIHYNAGEMGPIHNLRAVSIADHMVTLRFSEPQGAESIVLEQSEDGQNWRDSVIYGTLTSSSVTVAVTGLKPRTDYQFRLRVMGGKREGVSNIAQVTTDSADVYSLISEGCITKVLGSPIVSSVARGESVWAIADEVYQGKDIEFIALPESLRTIGKRTFADCENLATAFLPSSLESIGDEAFAGCGNLMVVYYNGTETQWEGIEKGNDAIPEQATVHFIENSLPISDFTACAATNCTATFSFSPAINAEEVVLEQSTDGTTWTAAKTDRPMAYDTSVVVAEDLDMQTSYSFRLRVTGGIRDGISNEATITTTGYTAEEDFQFTNGTITKYIGTAESVSVPPTIGGKPVKAIGDEAFRNNYQLKSICFSEGMAEIGSRAFSGCSGLTSISIPNSVSSIGESAFFGCTSLTNIIIPDGVKEILRDTFYRSGLQTVTIPNSVVSVGLRAFAANITEVHYFGTRDQWDDIYIEYGIPSYDAFDDPMTGTIINGGSNWQIEFALKHFEVYVPETDFTFENGVITSYTGNEAVVTIPHSINQQIVTKIGDNVFAGNTTITEVIIPSTVEVIGNKTFSGCTNLTSVSSNVTEIGDYAFENCEKLKDIELPKTLSYLGTGAFAGCAQLRKILLADRITEIKNDTFSGCSSLTELNISDSVTSIGRNAFSGCKVNIYFDGTMEEWDVLTENANIVAGEVNVIPYDKSLFVVWDTGLLKNYSGTSETVVIPPVINGTLVTGISQGIFDGRYSIKEVFIPNTVTNIYDGTFSGCKGLTSVTIPEGVISIGSYAFYGCRSLTSISIPDSVTSIGSYAFCGCRSLTSISIPDSVTSIGDGAFSGIAYYEDDSNWVDNVLYIDNFLIEARSELSGEYEIKNGTKVIADNAFNDCPLTKITIPNSVTHIGNGVFNHCWPLTNVTIPNSVISIGDHAFVNCMGLTSITIPDSVISIGESAFYGCVNLKDVYYGGTERQWNEISRNADVGESVIIHFLGTESMPVDDLKVERVSNQTVSLSFSTPVGADAITIEQSDNGVNWSTAATEQPVTPLSSKAVVMNLQPNTTYYFRLQVTGGSNAGVSNVVSTMTSEYTPPEEYVFANGVITGYTGTDTEISIPDEINGIPVTAIGAAAFASSDLVSVVIPDTVISIETEAFSGCEDLTHVTLPDSLASIAEKAFTGCSKLTSIAYNGTPEEWSTLVAQNADAELESMMVEYIPNVKTVAVKEGNQTIFEVSAKNVPESSTIILALYKDNRLIGIQKAVYENQKMIFTATVEYDIAKVMAWGDLNDMTPVCEPDIVLNQK